MRLAINDREGDIVLAVLWHENDERLLMTIKEAAALLAVEPATLRQQIANGKLKATKRGRDWWVTPAEVKRYEKEHKR